MKVRALVLILVGLASGAARLNQLIADIDSVAALIASNNCQAAQNRLDDIAAAFDECAELAAAPRICDQIGPLLAVGKREESLHILDFNRSAVTNSIVLSVLVSRLQTQIGGVVVADLEAKRLDVYRQYQTALQRLTAARDERNEASSRRSKIEKEIHISLKKTPRIRCSTSN